MKVTVLRIGVVLMISAIQMYGVEASAQKVDSLQNIKTLTTKQADSLYLRHPLKEQINSIRQDFLKTWNKVFIDFSNNTGSLLAGLNLSKQNIDASGFTSPYNYNLSRLNKNAFKPGFTIGYRVDGLYKNKHAYSIAFNVNKFSSGANYQSKSSLIPFIEPFTNFKVDEQLVTFSIAAHYKKLLPLMDINKYKWYVVLGPNIGTRLSSQSLDNQVINAYHKMFFRADLGLEFENNGFYSLFLHYHHPITSFTNKPINNKLTSLDFGMFIKAKDLF